MALLLAAFPATAAMYPDQGRAYAACQADIKSGPAGWQPMKCAPNYYNDGSGIYYAWDLNGRAVGWSYAWPAN
ncbi:TPA: hypothetical protein ACGCHS_004284, partial [Stenotrophomonas maltophilia]